MEGISQGNFTNLAAIEWNMLLPKNVKLHIDIKGKYNNSLLFIFCYVRRNF